MAQREEIGETLLLEPAPAMDELAAEISDMRDGTAKRCEPEAQKYPKHVKHPGRPRIDGWVHAAPLMIAVPLS